MNDEPTTEQIGPDREQLTAGDSADVLEAKKIAALTSLQKMRDQSAIFNTIKMHLDDPKLSPASFKLKVVGLYSVYEQVHGRIEYRLADPIDPQGSSGP